MRGPARRQGSLASARSALPPRPSVRQEVHRPAASSLFQEERYIPAAVLLFHEERHGVKNDIRIDNELPNWFRPKRCRQGNPSAHSLTPHTALRFASSTPLPTKALTPHRQHHVPTAGLKSTPRKPRLTGGPRQPRAVSLRLAPQSRRGSPLLALLTCTNATTVGDRFHTSTEASTVTIDTNTVKDSVPTSTVKLLVLPGTPASTVEDRVPASAGASIVRDAVLTRSHALAQAVLETLRPQALVQAPPRTQFSQALMQALSDRTCP